MVRRGIRGNLGGIPGVGRHGVGDCGRKGNCKGAAASYGGRRAGGGTAQATGPPQQKPRDDGHGDDQQGQQGQQSRVAAAPLFTGEGEERGKVAQVRMCMWRASTW